MMKSKQKKLSRYSTIGGAGLLNTVINKLPIELHLPGYQYCGPGTNLQQRLRKGDPGINPLDKACKAHDIAYSIKKDLSERHKADKILCEKAWSRVTSKDAGFSERANALLVSNIMKAKVKLGMGIKTKLRKGTKSVKRKLASVTFKKTIQNVGKLLQTKKPNSTEKAIKIALGAVKKTLKKNKTIKVPRVIPLPKTGGALPFLLPLFAGLSALGSLSGGAASIAKAYNDAKMAKKDLEEKKKHNKKMEAIAVGSGLYLKPYRKGFGLYLKPYPKNC